MIVLLDLLASIAISQVTLHANVLWQRLLVLQPLALVELLLLLLLLLLVVLTLVRVQCLVDLVRPVHRARVVDLVPPVTPALHLLVLLKPLLRLKLPLQRQRLLLLSQLLPKQRRMLPLPCDELLCV